MTSGKQMQADDAKQDQDQVTQPGEVDTPDEVKSPDAAGVEEFQDDHDALVKQIQALSHLTPTEALNAAIVASAKSGVLEGKAIRRAAANDQAFPARKYVDRQGLPTRLHLPLAACLVVAVFIAVSWYPTDDLQVQPVQAPDAAAALPAAAAAEPAAAVTEAVPPKPAQTVAAAVTKTVPTPAKPTAPVAPTPVAAAKPATPPAVVNDKKIGVQTTATPSVTNATLKPAPVPEPPSAPAPAQAPAQTAPSQSVAKETATEDKAVATPVVSAPAAKPELSALEKARAWIVAIEEMSKNPSRKEAALVQLDRFEKSYPYYPVPEALRASLR